MRLVVLLVILSGSFHQFTKLRNFGWTNDRGRRKLLTQLILKLAPIIGIKVSFIRAGTMAPPVTIIVLHHTDYAHKR